MGTSNGKPQYDLETVRLAASGRWEDIFINLGGVPAESLDASREHPCPKCGGDTRFRLVDKDAGALFCNHCNNKRNGDGFAAIGWLLDCDFKESIVKVAEYCGVGPNKGGRGRPKGSKADPAKDLEFQEWSSQLVNVLLFKKKGFTEEAMLAAGAKKASYKKKYTVYAFPIIGQDLDVTKPVGWALIDYQGNEIPVYKGQNIVGSTKVKITYGSQPGLLGIHGIERLKMDGLVDQGWKVEGLSDLLSLWSNMPPELRDKQPIVSTSCGAGETPRWQASFLASHNMNVVGDADKPGQDGAKSWTQAIAIQQGEGKWVRNVELPYEVQPKKGKDIRDYFLEANRYSDLEALADKALKIVIAKNEDGTIKDHSQIENHMEDRIMKLLQIEIMEEDERGHVRIFSTFLRKSSVVPNVSRLRIEDILQICGKPAKQCVVMSASDADHLNTFSVNDVKQAIALTASSMRGNDERRGVGVWQGMDESGNETNTIVLVNNTEAARWNGDKVLRRVLAPRVDGLVLDFGAGQKDWFDFDELERNLKHCEEKDWCQDVVDQGIDLFSRWAWKNPIIDPTLVTGLVIASWVQTVWEWRPLVSLSGKTNSGKSYLYHAIGGKKGRTGLLSRLVYRSAKSTEPGIRQNINNTAKVIMCDEFEKSKDRDLILEKIFRPSTRGDSIGRGSGTQKGTSTDFQHLGWITATETGLTKRPDLNRFIQLFLRLPARENHGKLILPDGRELQTLGQKMLALAVHGAMVAKSLAVRLKSTRLDAIDARMVEGYSVPAAMLATSLKYDEAQTVDLLEWLVSGVDKDEQDGSDEEDLLEAILSAQVNCGAKDGNLSVAQLIQSSSGFMEYQYRMEAIGVAKLGTEDDHALFVDWRQLTRTALRNSPWDGKRLDNVLEGLPGAYKARRYVGGRRPRGVVIPRSLYDVYQLNCDSSSENQDQPSETQGEFL